MERNERSLLERLSFVMSYDTGMMNTDQMETLARNEIYTKKMKEANIRFLAQKAIFENKEIEEANEEEEEAKKEPIKKEFSYQVLSNARNPISRAYSKLSKGGVTVSDIKSLISQLERLIPEK